MKRKEKNNLDEETIKELEEYNEILLNTIELLLIQTDLMTQQLTTPIHSERWVKNYFREEAMKKWRGSDEN